MEFLASNKVLIIVATLVLVAIVLDGMRRAKRNRYEDLQMSSSHLDKASKRRSSIEEVEDVFSDDPVSSVSRRVGRNDANSTDDMEDILLSSRDISERYGSNKGPQQRSINFEGESGSGDTAEFSDGDGAEPRVMMVHLMGNKGHMVQGSDLLEALMAAGLRYGAMGIFHFHRDDNGGGPVVFSLANLLNPGTFDLNTMPDMTTLGVTLFTNLDEADDPCASFEAMVSAADTMAAMLRLNVMDESRSSMTPQTFDHYRQRARDAVRHKRGS